MAVIDWGTIKELWPIVALATGYVIRIELGQRSNTKAISNLAEKHDDKIIALENRRKEDVRGIHYRLNRSEDMNNAILREMQSDIKDLLKQTAKNA